MPWILLRVALIAFAIALGAWMVFGIHEVGLQASGEATLKRAQRHQVSDVEVTRALDELRRADRYNPDLTPLLDQGFLLNAHGKLADGYVISRKAIAKEPENVQAWVLMALWAPSPAIVRRAKARVKELNPRLGFYLG